MFKSTPRSVATGNTPFFGKFSDNNSSIGTDEDFIDQCVAGERTRFEQLLSINIFNSFDRSYEVYRDYICIAALLSCSHTQDAFPVTLSVWKFVFSIKNRIPIAELRRLSPLLDITNLGRD